MTVQTLAAVILGKGVHFLTRTLNIGGGSAAPGYYALKIDPDLVVHLASQIPCTIIITGTNGKATTARMLAQFAKESGLKVIRNHTGSNLERGIASALLSHFPLLTSHLPDLAIWELDEAAFNKVIPKLKPDMIVFLNAFRDQLDRYGEVDSVVKKWCQTLKVVDPKTSIFINGDDHNLLALKDCFKGSVQTFGLESNKITGERATMQNKTHKLDFEARNIKLNGLTGSSFLLQTTNYKLQTTLPVPGIYHVYNFLAAYILAKKLDISDEYILNSLKTFQPAFGRVEKFDFGYIFLIKNPTGATQVLQTLAPELKSNDRLLLALNDNLADGTDVSWIWDIDFEQCKVQPFGFAQGESAKCKVFVSGTRAEDMALRLKYADIDPKQIAIENNLERAFEEARIGLKGRLFILPTYTALLELQRLLTKRGLKKHYWKEAT